MIHMIAAVSDVHAGSDTAPAPERILLDDGSQRVRNKLQAWYHDKWLDAWGFRYSRLLDLYKPDKQHLICNGDLVEGKHHDAVDSLPLAGQHISIAIDLLLEGPLRYKPDSIHVVRGTEAHVGTAGQYEEAVAIKLEDAGHPVVRDPATMRATSYWRRLDFDGVLFDVRHHTSFGRTPHTKDAHLRNLAHRIWETHVRAGHPPPQLCLRGHVHQHGDSGRVVDMPTRLVVTPGWQGLTAWGHRQAIEDVGKCGLSVFIVRDGELLEPEHILYQPDRPQVVAV